MSDFLKDEFKSKSTSKNDWKLLKRLLKYTKPYILIMVICVVLIIISSLCDVSKPFLMKVAIDDYIDGTNDTMYVLATIPEGSKIKNQISYNGKIYVFTSQVPKDSEITKKNLGTAHLEHTNNEDYLVTNNKEKTLLTKEEYSQFRAKDKKGVLYISSLLFLVLLVGFLTNYGQTYLLNYIGQQIIYKLRTDLFAHLQKLPLSFFDKNPVGKIVTRVTNDMENINELFTSVIVTFLKDISLLVFTASVMFLLNYKLALVCFSTLPIVMVCTYFFRITSRNANRKVKEKLSKINVSLNENIMGMKTIQIFNKEKDIFNEFYKVNEEHKKASMGELLVFSIFRPGMNLIYNLTLTVLIWVGARSMLSGAIEFGILFAFIKYIQDFYDPIFDLSEKLNILQAAMTSAERIFGLLDVPVEKDAGSDALPLGKLNGSIEFKNVWFKYGDEWILKDVSFKINPGEMAAFVGATGSGKTTIISLITGLYQIQKGQILVDNINIDNIKKAELRRQIGTVLQDVFLFSGDIKDNIRLNNKEFDMMQIKEVCDYVNATKFIEKFSDTFDHEVRERGSTLSSGERQLLSFARALIFNPSVLILDEATANIDTETESLIQDAIAKVTQNRTTIVVAHRLSTIQHANKIIVMDKGVLREIGTHEELLKEKGLYFNLHSLQYDM